MYLLDTNVCIGVITGKSLLIRNRMQKVLAANTPVMVPSIVVSGLWYGVGKSKWPVENARTLEAFFLGPIGILAFESEDAKVAGEVRAALEALGKPIGAYDVLIAGQAIRNKLTLVTANVREFERVKGLRWEDWAKP